MGDCKLYCIFSFGIHVLIAIYKSMIFLCFSCLLQPCWTYLLVFFFKWGSPWGFLCGHSFSSLNKDNFMSSFMIYENIISFLAVWYRLELLVVCWMRVVRMDSIVLFWNLEGNTFSLSSFSIALLIGALLKLRKFS